MNFAKILRTPFLQNTSGRLLLEQLINLRGRRHEEYLDYRLGTNKISGNEKEASYLAPNIELVSSKSNKTDNTSLGNLSGKSI